MTNKAKKISKIITIVLLTIVLTITLAGCKWYPWEIPYILGIRERPLPPGVSVGAPPPDNRVTLAFGDIEQYLETAYGVRVERVFAPRMLSGRTAIDLAQSMDAYHGLVRWRQSRHSSFFAYYFLTSCGTERLAFFYRNINRVVTVNGQSQQGTMSDWVNIVSNPFASRHIDYLNAVKGIQDTAVRAYLNGRLQNTFVPHMLGADEIITRPQLDVLHRHLACRFVVRYRTNFSAHIINEVHTLMTLRYNGANTIFVLETLLCSQTNTRHSEIIHPYRINFGEFLQGLDY